MLTSDKPSMQFSLTLSGEETGATPEERKKKYAEDLRRQMEEQKKAKLKEREEYHASPSIKRRNAVESSSPVKQRLISWILI